MIEIRLLKDGEEEEFIKLKLQSLKVASRYLVEHPNYNPTIEKIKSQLNAIPRGMIIYVLMYQGKMFGIIQFSLGTYLYRTHHAMVHGLYVSKDIYKIGQLKNNIPNELGTRLMTESILYLQSIGIEIITSSSFNDNIKMSNIFYSLNFIQLHTDHFYLKFENNSYRGVSSWYLETSKLKILY